VWQSFGCLLAVWQSFGCLLAVWRLPFVRMCVCLFEIGFVSIQIQPFIPLLIFTFEKKN
jgi:hypothetical protein